MAEKVGRHLWPFPKADIFFESHKNKVFEISYNVTVPIIQLCQSFYNQENVLHFAQNIHEMKNSWRFFLFFRTILSVSYQFFLLLTFKMMLSLKISHV